MLVRTKKNILEFMIWIILGLISTILLTLEKDSYRLVTIYCGIIIMLHSGIYFRVHGGRYITPTGLYLLYSALVQGYALIYINFVSYYKIRKTTVKGIYYITNYVDLNGKKYSKLYFGFDEEYKKIVITDKNGNIKNVLNFRAMN